MNNQKDNQMNDRRRFFRIFLVLAFFSVMSLSAILTDPRVSNIRTVDIVRLIGAGMCIGGAVGAFFAYFRRRNL